MSRGVTQLDLYGGEHDPTPIARNTDPWTSHLAAQRYLREGERETCHKKALRVVLDSYEPLTAEEIGKAAGVNRCGRRMPELERLGLVERADVRDCSVTGYKAATWRIPEGTT